MVDERLQHGVVAAARIPHVERPELGVHRGAPGPALDPPTADDVGRHGERGAGAVLGRRQLVDGPSAPADLAGDCA
jgi:hypothetical protein